MTDSTNNPAVEAALIAQAKVDACLDLKHSFRVEAGAGAGKTYSLVQALRRIILQRGTELLQAGQMVACITYTEVARSEIAQNIDRHPAVVVETIHSFSWSFLAQFQKAARQYLVTLEDRADRFIEGGGVGTKSVEYNRGFFGVEAERITLSHDDVPLLMAYLLGHEKFRRLLTQHYPVIVIDEYQDTDKHFMAAVSSNFLETKQGPIFGLFGDHWQKIYGDEFDMVTLPIDTIEKGSNFRSAPAIIAVLNRLRPELTQGESNPNAVGEVSFYHANSYTGERTSARHSKNDVPDDLAHQYLESLLARLEMGGWDMAPTKTKVLMLTHSALAAKQGYPTVAAIFDRNEAFAKKEDPTIEFFADQLEPMCRAYAERKYGNMFRMLGTVPAIETHADKLDWTETMDSLVQVRLHGTVGDVLDHLKKYRRRLIPDRVMRREDEVAALSGAEIASEATQAIRQLKLRTTPYHEIIELVRFIDRSTPFATQHSVKGAEYDNVVVVLGGGWSKYNWPQLFELLETGAINKKNSNGYHRARNLFYVSISRPKKRLAVLATQTMSALALRTARRLFGNDNVYDLEH